MNIENQKRKILGMLGISAKAGKMVCGTDATLEDIERRKVCLVIVAENASDKTKKNIEFVCKKKKVEYIEFGNIDEISKAIGKNHKSIIGINSTKSDIRPFLHESIQKPQLMHLSSSITVAVEIIVIRYCILLSFSL